MSQERSFSFGKTLTFSVILMLLLLAAAEIGVRVWAYYLRGVYERYDASSQTFELIPGQYSTLRINSAGFVGDELPDDLADSIRVFAIGDSCTFGDMDYKSSYPRALEELLRANGVPARVINGGVEGLNSEMALRRFRAKAPTVKPDVAVIYIGWNDLMKNSPTGQAGSGVVSAMASALDQLWLTKALRKLIFFYIRPLIFVPQVGPEGYSGVFRDFEPRLFQTNVEGLVEAARDIGATPILVTLPYVLDKSMTQDDLRAANVVFPYFPDANHLYDFIDLVEAYNRTIRRVAEARGVRLIDLAQHFNALADKRPYFYDTMHANANGRRIIASILERSVAEAADVHASL